MPFNLRVEIRFGLVARISPCNAIGRKAGVAVQSDVDLVEIDICLHGGIWMFVVQPFQHDIEPGIPLSTRTTPVLRRAIQCAAAFAIAQAVQDLVGEQVVRHDHRN